jgi:PHAX RNA-binding domain
LTKGVDINMSNEIIETAPTATLDSDPNQTNAQAREIAQALTEPNLVLIHKIITVIGIERTQAFLQEALTQEAQGGLLRKDGQRRTPGGAFFYLVRGKLPPVERRQLWSYVVKKNPAAPNGPRRDVKPAPPPVTWEQVQALFQEVKDQSGEAKTVKLTLIGRPGKVVQQASCVVVAMKGKEPPSLPKGLPIPPANSTMTWAVFIATKPWEKVKDALTANPEDQLLVEGYPLMDPKSRASVVLATSCKSVMQERATREAKK